MHTSAYILQQTIRNIGTRGMSWLGTPAALTATVAANMLSATGQKAQAAALLMKTHSAGLSRTVDRRILARLSNAVALERQGHLTGLRDLSSRTISAALTSLSDSPNPDPRRLIGTRLLAIKSPRPGERGVIVADYNYIFPLLAGLFDLRAIVERYFLVLEPGWNGYCSPDILLFSHLPGPVFVETIEPRDRDVLIAFGDPYRPAHPLSTNSWVDYRHSVTVSAERRDIDVIMVAAWARYKNHWEFFRAISELRRRGRRLNVTLVGYPVDLTRHDILPLARHYGIDDQITIHERVSQKRVAELLARSRLHVLWSNREGSNRAIIEAMFAGVPTILKDGFNYGYHYPHINPQTGRYVPEHQLADAIEETLGGLGAFSPREWALDNVTCQHATARLEAVVRDEAVRLGEPWTTGLAVRVSTLDTQDYWDPAARSRFDEDHAFLESVLLPRR